MASGGEDKANKSRSQLQPLGCTKKLFNAYRSLFFVGSTWKSTGGTAERARVRKREAIFLDMGPSQPRPTLRKGGEGWGTRKDWGRNRTNG
jgi:hypothetical protein